MTKMETDMYSNESLVNALVRDRALETPRIIEAFRAVDRKDFVLPAFQDEAYDDYPLAIGSGQTISQPTTVAFMLELLKPEEGDRILDVGSGSGWTTALLSRIVGSDGYVFGVEIVPVLVELGQRNLAKYAPPNADIRKSEKALGLVSQAPFEKILVSAAGRNIPAELIDQLRPGGRMVIPIGNAILKIEKTDTGETKEERFEGFVFVPLIHEER